MEYRSVSDLNDAVVRSLARVPNDIDVVVGVPRSGMLPASLFALYLHVPLTDVEGYLDGRLLRSGPRLGATAEGRAFAENARVLVVDDSVASGAAMREVRERMASLSRPVQATYMAVFAAPEAVDLVDLHLEVVPTPRLFEWNLLNSWCARDFCVDIDGVLCRDPTDAENDDGERYLEFVRSVHPMMRTRKPIGYIVTSRLEKYRQLTEEWLARQGIVYKRLYMMDYRSAEERRAANAYSDFKAQVYLDTRAVLFVESAKQQAIEIARKAHKPVYCTELSRMVRPGDGSSASDVGEALSWKLRHLAIRARRKFARQLNRSMYDLMRRLP